jgi:hypothetical protein
VNKVLVDKSATGGVVPYLPLPSLAPTTSSASPSNGGALPPTAPALTDDNSSASAPSAPADDTTTGN